MLDFVVSDIGGVRRAAAKDQSHHEQVFLARKTVGNLLDMTALATFHMSPLTVLAIFSDVAYGSKIYMQQLSLRLKEQGIIDESTTIDGAAELPLVEVPRALEVAREDGERVAGDDAGRNAGACRSSWRLAGAFAFRLSGACRDLAA